jgi:hypothetical protein
MIQGDVTMRLELLSPSNAYPEVMTASPFDGYNSCSEADNAEIYNLVVRLTGLAKERNMSVVLSEAGTEIETFDRTLADWYSLCTMGCQEMAQFTEPHWLANSEVYY